MSDLESVTGSQHTQVLACIWQPNNVCQVAEVEIMLAEQLVQRVATIDVSFIES